MYLAALDFHLFVYFSVAAGCRVHHPAPYPTSLKAGEAGEFGCAPGQTADWLISKVRYSDGSIACLQNDDMHPFGGSDRLEICHA